MDNSAAKANQHKTWQAVAPGWKQYDELMRRLTKPVTDRMTAGMRPGQRVLDIASGVGEPAIAIAERVGPTGSVLGTDLVEEMLAFAREKAAARGVKNIEFRHVDGEALDVPDRSFDAVTMRWGLMFMPDPGACLTRARQALKPGGTIALTCWAPIEKNPWALIPMSVLRKYVEVPAPPPGAPGLFAFADRARLESVLKDAGFSNVNVEPVETLMGDFDKGEEFVAFILALAGPIAMLMKAVPEDKRAAATNEIAREAERVGGGRARVPGVTWLATAQA
jgi:ubiquinone/menaquinone biosynthesis C-methylase UbiE